MKTVKMAKTVDEAVEKGLKELGLTRDQVDIRVLEEPKSGLFGLIGNKDAVVEIESKEDLFKQKDGDIISEIESELQTAKKREERRRPEPEEEPEAEEPKKAPETVEIKETAVETGEEKVTKEEIKEETGDKVSKEKITEEQEKTPEKKEEKKEDKEEEKEEEEDFVIENKNEIRQKANNFLAQMLYDMGIPSSIEYTFDKNFLRFEIIPEDSGNIGIVIGKRGETLDAIQYLVNLVTNRYSDTYIRVVLDINNYRHRRENSLKRLAKNMARKAVQYQKTMKLEPMNPYERRIIHTAIQKEPHIKTYSEGKDPYRRVVIEYVE